MKKYNLDKVTLMSDYTCNYMHPDFINCEVVKDGDNPTIKELSEIQAKIALCIMIKYLESVRKKLAKIDNILLDI